MLSRRTFFLASAAATAATGAGAWSLFGGDPVEAGAFPLSLTEAEWRARLTPQEFDVLRDHGTEPAFSSPLNAEKRAGTFVCAGCAQAVYRSADKFESGTGWPSFTRAIDGAVGNAVDRSFLMTRTEEHCSNCGGHLGHVFEDGPPPTGLRHCINGVALDFVPA